VGLQEKLVEDEFVLVVHRANLWSAQIGFTLAAQVFSDLHPQSMQSH